MSQSIREETILQQLFDQSDYNNDFDFEIENNNVIILPNTSTTTPTPTPTANSTIVEEEVDLSIPLVPPIFEIPEGCIEPCPICFEQVDGINISVSTCGHVFHCYCLLRAVKKNSHCPLCRHLLIKNDNEEDDDDDYDDMPHLITDTDDDSTEESNSSFDSSSTETDNESQVTLEQLANKMTNLGYTMADLLYLITPINSQNPKHTDDFCDKIFDTIDNIKNQTIPLSQRDNRSYSQVVVGTRTNTPACIVSVSNNSENMFENTSNDSDITDNRTAMLIRNYINSLERRDGVTVSTVVQSEETNQMYGRFRWINWN